MNDGLYNVKLDCGRVIRVTLGILMKIEEKKAALAIKGRQTVAQLKKHRMGPRPVAGNPIATWIGKNNPKHSPDTELVYTTGGR